MGVVGGTKGTDDDVSVAFVVTGGVDAWPLGGFLDKGLFGLLACGPEVLGPCAFGLVDGTVLDFPDPLEGRGGSTESLRLFIATIWAVNAMGVTEDGSFEKFEELRTAGKRPKAQS